MPTCPSTLNLDSLRDPVGRLSANLGTPSVATVSLGYTESRSDGLRGGIDRSAVNYTRRDGNQEFNASQLRDSILGRFELDGERYGILFSMAALRRRIRPRG